MNSLFQDLHFGLRMLTRNPLFSVIAVVTLALGIGANTAIFSVVDAVLLRPLPYPEANRLVFLWSAMNSQGVRQSGSSLPDYYEWRDQNRVFDGLGGFYYGDFTLSSGADPERVYGALITANLFDVLRVSPALGRSFTHDEEQFGKHRVVLLSYALWQRRFGGSRDIVGRGINLGGQTYTVAGVMPNGLPFFDNLPEVELWVPMAFEADDSMGTRNNHFINLVGRLKPDTTPAQAQADASAIAERIAERFPSNKGVGALIVPMQEQLAGDSRSALLVLLGAVAFVLLVACLNVANLLLARASARQRELAIRASLGASRARIIRQVIVECLPIGLLGGVLGALLAWWGINFLSSLLPSTLPRGNAIEINGRVLAFTLGLSLLTILLFGLLPAFYSSRSDVQRALNEGGRSGIGGRRQGRLRRLLIIAEVAIALVLLAASGLMVRTFIKLRQVDIGFTARNVLTMRVPLPETKYPFPLTAADPREPAGLAFSEKLLSRIKSLPGVTSAATGSTLPLGAGVGWGKLLNIDSRPATSLDQMPDVRFALVSDDYFRTFGISVRQGRSFNAQDQSNSQPVAIINETLAQRFFPNENPIGKSVTMGPPAELLPADERGLENLAPHRIIAGVVSDVKGGSLNQPTPAQVYAPLTQHRREGWVNLLMLAVQTNVPPASLTSAIREQVRGLDPDLPLTNIQTVDDLLSRTLSQAKFSLLLLGLFSVVGLLLAAIGIYGVMATTVAQRTQEFGVRIALGAQTGDVLRLVVGQGMMLIGLGIVAGLVTAFAVTRLMSSLLFGVSPNDPTTLAAITVLLVTVALLACYIPARRATKVDPLVALRYE
jgi:putative ABC transport system permease protein